MSRSSKRLPKDPTQLAAEIVRLSTEEETDLTEVHDIKSPQVDWSVLSRYLAEIGRKGGLKGGKARAKTLSKTRRKEIATEAAKARWRTKRSDKE